MFLPYTFCTILPYFDLRNIHMQSFGFYHEYANHFRSLSIDCSSSSLIYLTPLSHRLRINPLPVFERTIYAGNANPDTIEALYPAVSAAVVYTDFCSTLSAAQCYDLAFVAFPHFKYVAAARALNDACHFVFIVFFTCS